MKKNLIIRYIGRMLARRNASLRETRSYVGNKTYLEMVRTSIVSEFPQALRSEMEAKIIKRFRLKPHGCVFSNPTVEQWVTDLTGRFSKEDILTIFAQTSGFPKDVFRTGKCSENILDRASLEDIVQSLEAATCKNLSISCDSSCTYAQIADFFATA